MSTELALAVQRIGESRIIVLGDYIFDREEHGVFSRFAAENSAVPIFRSDKTIERSGGAGAVCEMVKALGGDGILICGGETSYDSTIKTRYYADGQFVFRADINRQVPLKSQDRSLRRIDEEIELADAVLIADYGRGTCTAAVLRAAIDGAKERGIPCIADPHQHPWQRYAGATALKLNAAQARGQTDKLTACDEFAAILETLGDRGIMLAERGYPDARIWGRARHVVDVTGAGDMVLAALGVCLAGYIGPCRCGNSGEPWCRRCNPDSLSWPDACRVANAAAGLKVERRGAVPVPKCEVVADLVDGKIIPAELMSSIAQAAKLRGDVVWANGCFDGHGLHRGHLHYLAEAKKQGQTLIVGVNGDQSVRALKGNGHPLGVGRPISPIADRLNAVSALECVDYVVEFSDDEHLVKLIRSVAPSVLCKGSDWKGKDVVGAADSGRVHFVERLAGYATSKQ